MAALSGFPPELILHTVSFLTRLSIVDKHKHLPEHRGVGLGSHISEPQLIPDLPSINALSQTCTVFHSTLNQCLYDLCARVDSLGRLALFFALKHDMETVFDRFVSAGVSFDSKFYFRGNCRGLLQVAAAMGLQGMVVKLLRMHGEDLPVRAYTRVSARAHIYGVTALDYAAQGQHVEIVRLLAPIPPPVLSIPHRGGQHSSTSEFKTRRLYLSLALLGSSKVGNIEISEYLISEGADVNFFDGSLGPALYFAAGKNFALVQLLLAAGAQPNLYQPNLYEGEKIPLCNALHARDPDINIVRALADGGADIHCLDRFERNMLSISKTIELLRFFLERGVDPNHEDLFGETPLHHVCKKPDAEFAKASVELLLQFGAVTVAKLSNGGRTPVDIAMGKGHSEIVKILEPLVLDPDLKLKIARWSKLEGWA